MNERASRQCQILGWILFTLSGFLFIWSTAASGDLVGLLASLLFLIACPVFLAPILRAAKREARQ